MQMHNQVYRERHTHPNKHYLSGMKKLCHAKKNYWNLEHNIFPSVFSAVHL